jgi:hypothetical protein
LCVHDLTSGVCSPGVVSFDGEGPSFDCVSSRVSFGDGGLSGVCIPSFDCVASAIWVSTAADEETKKTESRISFYVIYGLTSVPCVPTCVAIDDVCVPSVPRGNCLPSGVCVDEVTRKRRVR